MGAATQQKDPNHSHLVLLFYCRNGADWTGTPPSMYARCISLNKIKTLTALESSKFGNDSGLKQ
jgi:hypothetical protein